MLMRGEVLTGQDASVQVVNVFDPDGEQMAVVVIENLPSRPMMIMQARDENGLIRPGLRSAVIEAAREALRERETRFLRTCIARVRSAVNSGIGASRITEPVLSPSGRRMSFSFRYAARNDNDNSGEYEVIIRRKRPQS